MITTSMFPFASEDGDDCFGHAIHDIDVDSLVEAMGAVGPFSIVAEHPEPVFNNGRASRVTVERQAGRWVAGEKGRPYLKMFMTTRGLKPTPSTPAERRAIWKQIECYF